MKLVDPDYLRSRQRRGKGRWFHYYRRAGKEISLGVHGLHRTDPRVFAAYCAAHARWGPPSAEVPKGGTFAWAVDIYQATSEWKTRLKPQTKQNREAIYRRYVKAQGARPLSTITRDNLESALVAKGGHAAVNELKALRPVFVLAYKLKLIPVDPTFGLKMKRPESEGFPTATADELEAFQKRWPIGTTERLALDLTLLTGAAREGVDRTTAAKSCGMDRQTLRDWVHRYNAEGVAGLLDRSARQARR